MPVVHRHSGQLFAWRLAGVQSLGMRPMLAGTVIDGHRIPRPGSAGLVPLAALADKEFSLVALRMAAQQS